MSLEAVQKVTEAEQRSRERRAEAAENAKRLVAEAEKDGKARLSAARSEAEAKARALMAEAEAKAARHTQAVMEDQRKSCDGLRREAEAKLDEAAAMIVRRVVGV